MHRYEYARDVFDMRICAFRSVIRGKSGVATMRSERAQKSKRQYFNSHSTTYGCDPSGQKWPVGALEIGKVAVAAVRVPFL